MGVHSNNTINLLSTMYSWKSSIVIALLIATAALYSEATQENVAEEAEEAAAPAKIKALDALVEKLNKKFYAKHKKDTKTVKKTAKKPDSQVKPIDDETDNEMLVQMPNWRKVRRKRIGDGWHNNKGRGRTFDDAVRRLGASVTWSRSVTKRGQVTRMKKKYNFNNSARWTAVNDLTVADCKMWKNVGSIATRYAGKYYNYCRTQLLTARSRARKHKVRRLLRRVRRKKKFYGPKYMWLLGEKKRF